MRLIGALPRGPLLPEQLAVSAREAHQRPSGADGLGDEDFVPENNRRRVARFRQIDLPPDVFIRAPLEREVRFAGHPVAIRPAPGGPVGGGQWQRGGGEKSGKEQMAGKHGASLRL